MGLEELFFYKTRPASYNSGKW